MTTDTAVSSSPSSSTSSSASSSWEPGTEVAMTVYGGKIKDRFVVVMDRHTITDKAGRASDAERLNVEAVTTFFSTGNLLSLATFSAHSRKTCSA